MRKDKKPLAETHPEIAQQWHPKLNGDLTPNDVTKGSNKKVWWKCQKGDDHEWESSVNNRTKRGCPICSGKKVVGSNCLATLNPKLADEWHPTLNGDLTPSDVTPGSRKKVWWKCDKGDDHLWESSISNRAYNQTGCPVCSNQKVVESKSLAITHPEVSKQWHPTKNGNLLPTQVTSGSNKTVWWKCDKGDDHIYKERIYNKSNGKKCKVCSKKIIVKSNCLAALNPKLASEWHPFKNGTLTPNDVSTNYYKKVWWKCDKGDDHEWQASVHTRENGSGCSVCANITIVSSNCLATLNPKLADEWHPTKNENLTPFDVSEGSDKLVWWKCDKGDDHEWQTPVYRRKVSGCPFCLGQEIDSTNSMDKLFPEIARQWHPTLNGDLYPSDIRKSSNRKVWWKCQKGSDHVWRASPNTRTKGHGCPFCTLTPQSKQELTITFELMKFFKNIDPNGFKTRLDGRLRAIDIYIPKLNLCVEFDGAYWHKGKRELDKIKSEMLFEEGFKLIRVREEPLKKIYDTDVISKQPYNGKQVTNDILSMILSVFELDAKLVSKIKAYQSKDGLQNEKGLEKYIDKILTEKAEKLD